MQDEAGIIDVANAKPNEFDLMVKAVERISVSMRKLTESRVHRDLILALIHEDTKLSKKIIGQVLDSWGDLERKYLKPKTKKV